MNVRLHIEQLVLDGLPVGAADGPAVQAAVQAELERLLGASGVGPGLRQGGALAEVTGAGLRIAPSVSAETLGRQIGGAVHRGLVP